MPGEGGDDVFEQKHGRGRARLRPEPIMFRCGGCNGLLLALPPGWSQQPHGDVVEGLEAVRLMLPCVCDD